MRGMGAARRVMAAMVVVALSGACTSTSSEQSGGSTERSGGSTEQSGGSTGVTGARSPGGPTALRIGIADPPGQSGAQLLAELVRRIGVLSDRSIEAEPVYDAAGAGAERPTEVARMVADGELAGAIVPAGAWDAEGGAGLSALGAPFLLTSDEAVAAVVADPVAADILAGLDRAGVVGVALLPGGLHHPFGVNGPVLGPADYQGSTMRSASRGPAWDLAALLGAESTDETLDLATHDVVDATFEQLPPGTAAGNVTLYADVYVVVMNRSVWDGLDAASQVTVTEAAVATRDWAVDTRPPDAQSALSWCGAGGTVALASDADLSALRAAADPVVAGLEQDPATKSFVERIRTIVAGKEAAVPIGPCRQPATIEPFPAAGSQGDLDGVYQFDLGPELLEGNGASGNDVRINQGAYTVTVRDGLWCWDQTVEEAAAVPDPTGCARLEIGGPRVRLTFTDGTWEDFTWSRSAAGDVDLELVGAQPDGGNFWSRSMVEVDWTKVA